MKIFKSIGDYRSLEFWLLILVLLSAFAKIFLVGKGLLSFPDESRAFASANIIASLAEGDITKAIADLFSTQGRPGEALLNMIPVGVQYVTGKLFGLATFQSSNTWPFFLFNFICYLGILWLQFHIALLLFKNRMAALLAVFLFCCLTNSFVYLRHALPYDKSLIVFYYVLFQFIKKEGAMSQKTAFKYGLLAFFGFLIYPGYVLLYALSVGFLAIYNLDLANFQKRLKLIAVFALAGGILLGLVELLSRAAAVSYLEISNTLSGTIIQGAFEESFAFLPKYLWEVEGVLGILILLGTLVYFFSLLKTLSFATFFKQALPILFIGVTLLFLIYASAGYFFQKVTFYGRLIHQLLPILCLCTVGALLLFIPKSRLKPSILVCAVIAVVSFAVHFTNYLAFDYPLEVVWRFKAQHPAAVFEEQCEMENSWSMITNYKEQQIAIERPEVYQLVNACYFYPVPPAENYRAYEPSEESVLLYEAPHYKRFIGYQFEGLAPDERATFNEVPLTIRIYN